MHISDVNEFDEHPLLMWIIDSTLLFKFNQMFKLRSI
jgi:hypothetical protein